MKILAISCSASHNSGNYYLLQAIAELIQEHDEVEVYQGLYDFALFSPQRLKKGIPKNIAELKSKIKTADALLLSTPEYTHNIPAVLKNLIEWCTASGEFSAKKVVAITFTPHSPRGEHAMSSLLASLKTMEANTLAQLPIYRNEVAIRDQHIELTKEQKEIVKGLIELLKG